MTILPMNHLLGVEVVKHHLGRPSWLPRLTAPELAVLAGRDGPSWQSLSGASLSTVGSDAGVLLVRDEVEEARARRVEEDLQRLAVLSILEALLRGVADADLPAPFVGRQLVGGVEKSEKAGGLLIPLGAGWLAAVLARAEAEGGVAHEGREGLGPDVVIGRDVEALLEVVRGDVSIGVAVVAEAGDGAGGQVGHEVEGQAVFSVLARARVERRDPLLEEQPVGAVGLDEAAELDAERGGVVVVLGVDDGLETAGAEGEEDALPRDAADADGARAAEGEEPPVALGEEARVGLGERLAEERQAGHVLAARVVQDGEDVAVVLDELLGVAGVAELDSDAAGSEAGAAGGDVRHAAALVPVAALIDDDWSIRPPVDLGRPDLVELDGDDAGGRADELHDLGEGSALGELGDPDGAADDVDSWGERPGDPADLVGVVVQVVFVLVLFFLGRALAAELLVGLGDECVVDWRESRALGVSPVLGCRDGAGVEILFQLHVLLARLDERLIHD